MSISLSSIQKLDPENREEDEEDQPKLTNYAETLMHLMKSNIGSGVFAMGYAFSKAGLVLGVIFVLIIGSIALLCQHLMLRVCDDLGRRLNRNHPIGFEEAAELCFKMGHPRAKPFASTMGRAVKTFVCITQSGFCAVYIVFIATNIKQVWDNYLDPIDLHYMICIVIIPIIMLSWIREMKSLAPISVVANLFIISDVIIIIVVAVMSLPNISERRLVAPIGQIPLFFGTTIYTFEGIGLITPIKIKSKNPDRFSRLFGPLNVGMVSLVLVMLLLGFLGYWRWGDNVGDSLTLNICETTVLGQVVKIFISLGLLMTYPLQLSPAVTNIMPIITRCLGPFKRPGLSEIIFRTLYGLFLFALAEAIPHLGLFISLIGAVSSSALALIFPPIMNTVTFYNDYGKFNWKLWRNGLIILFGLFGFALGTFFSVRDIVVTFTNPPEDSSNSCMNA